MAEYIDKEIAYARLSIFGMNVQKMVTELPKANVKEIVYAHWIEEKEHLYLANGICKEWMNFYCSKCDVPSPAPTQYCPHCGAEMIEVK